MGVRYSARVSKPNEAVLRHVTGVGFSAKDAQQ